MITRVVVVDDEEDVRLFCSVVMERLGYDVASFGSGEEAIEHLSSCSAELLITDAKMPGISGLALIEQVREIDPAIASLVITGYGTMEMAFRAIRAGAQGFLPKPFSVQELRDAASHALDQARQTSEHASMKAMMPFVEFSQRLSSETSLGEAGAQITELVCRVCEVDGAGIVMLDPDGEGQRVLGKRGLFPDMLPPCRAHQDGGIEIMSAQQLEKGYLRESMETAGIDHMACVSLEAPSGHIGAILLVANGDLARFTHSSRQFLQAMSGQVAATLANIYMMAELRRWNHELEARVEERTIELEAAQDRLIKAQRLATIGELGASIAHEMRNPLGVISNSEYYLRMRLGDSDAKIAKHLDIIKREIVVSNSIITELMSFVRVASLNMQEVDPTVLVHRCVSRAVIPSNIQVTRSVPEHLPDILADEDKLEMVLMNLINNAVQAMPDGGDLVVSAREADGSVLFAVDDSGVGIAAENQARIFEPLFTTKARGIGLGLAIVHRLVEAHGGTIELSSELGRGTRFKVRIPARQAIGVTS